MNKTCEKDFPIDIVVPWIDNRDPQWRGEMSKYKPDYMEDGNEERYRDWELMRYWFRGIEKYVPWVRQIHFVTWGHLPEWLNTNHPKLRIVRHCDFLDPKFLPTFNVNAIELNLHRIQGLSEHFVYFNDDIFLLRPVNRKYFFRQGKPCDMLALQPVVANHDNPVMSHIFLNNSLVLAKYFRKRENMRKQPGSYFHMGYPPLYFGYNLLETVFPLFTGFCSVHGPAPLCKNTFLIVWEKERELLEQVSGNRFRSSSDVNQYLFREWQKLSGMFQPRNITAHFGYFNLQENNHTLEQIIRGHKKNIICINDAKGLEQTDQIRTKLQAAFEFALPNKSSYER